MQPETHGLPGEASAFRSERVFTARFCLFAVAAVSKGVHRVRAQQTGHAGRHPAGQRQHIRLHPDQPLQRKPRQRG